MDEFLTGYMSPVTPYLAYLIMIGFAPVAAMLLLVVLTRLENSLPDDKAPLPPALKG